MSRWPAAKAHRVLAALLSRSIKRQTGSHRTLRRTGFSDYVFAFHDGDEIGPRMLARVAKHTGLRPEDIRHIRTCRPQLRAVPSFVSPLRPRRPIRRRDVDQPQLHALLALPAVERQASGR